MPLWEIPEVVSEVILLLPKADQAQIAQVNNALWEMAIRHIWRDVPSIQHFCKLFPPDLWNKVEEPSTSRPVLNRALRDEDWNRFLLHSRHTRVTGYSTGDLKNAAPPDIWNHSLFSASFPSLERLEVNVLDSNDQGPINIIPLLLRPSLRRVDFFVETATAESPLISTLRTIAEHKQFSLEELSFHLIWDVAPLNGVAAQAIASQSHLRRLAISGFCEVADIAESAKDLPFLEELEVQGTGRFSGAPETEYRLGFRSLTTFIATGHPSVIHNQLRIIGSKRLVRVALTFKHWGSADLSPELLTELQRFRPHLTHLQLNVQGWFVWADLEPILNLAELQSFGLKCIGVDSREITNDRLRQMVEAWPSLLQLLIHTPPSHITLASLAYIAVHCPNLRKLAITFDAQETTNPPDSWDVEASLFNKNTLKLVDVMASAFDEGDEERLANIFRSWWPRARLSQSHPEPRSRLQWDIDESPNWPSQVRSGGQS
ncbi:hypothetical protein FS837_004266 [Tulasnella sp. UAMH 9824]|nr:hypothetical protein FS837_004266 [Tulasnella sp. UAMH 9824]